jgi:hypothetical protein
MGIKREMTKESQITVFHVKQNQDIDVYKGRVKEDKIYLKDSTVAQFTNSGVFTIVDRRTQKTRRYKCVIYLDGKKDCSEIREKEEIISKAITEMDPHELEKNPDLKEKITVQLQRLIGNAYSIFEPLTDQDRKTVVKREIAKQLGKFKPISNIQFAVLLIMLGIAIAIQFIPGI